VLLSQLFFFALAAKGTSLLLHTEGYTTPSHAQFDTPAPLC
jgi:hypothetical protein